MPIPRTTNPGYRNEESTVTLLPQGFGQLLPIVRSFVELHLGQIEEAARGTLESGTGAPSEEEAIECVIRMFEAKHVEADTEALEAYMRARTLERWESFPERQILTSLVQRADRRKNRIDEAYGRRLPSEEEGLRTARPLLACIPDNISLDSEGEFESMAKVLAALLSPPMGEPSPKTLQMYIELSKSHPVYSDALRRYYEELENPVKTLPRREIRWHTRFPGRRRMRYYSKTIIQPHSPIKPAILLRNLQMQFVIGLLKESSSTATGHLRIGLPHGGGCAGPFRKYREAHLGNALHARDAEAF